MKIKKVAFATILFFFYLVSSHAQEGLELMDMDSLQNREEAYIGNDYINASLTSPLENYNSVQFGYSYHPTKNRLWQARLGYIYGLDNLFSIGRIVNRDEEVTNTRGLQLFYEYRLFLNLPNFPSNSRTYVGFEPYLYYAQFNSEVIAGYSCQDDFGNCVYYRLFGVKNQRLVTGAYFKLGKVFYLDDLMISVFGGIGFRHTSNFNDIPGSPEPDRFYNREGDQREIPDGLTPNAKIGFEVGYRIK
ncbi:hypothetical protein GCM10027429_16870 [Marivirga atlantica]|uniref:DUF3575 domain-containing protein n=1 Tax=Marivirga atlantica TaxID=1548457 RepID=A0A937DIT8_9BACT|nr:hypothetical protein [Marivirga atlantica]MBL0765305.1 hypothetical protein [Marivirga atlantica]